MSVINVKPDQIIRFWFEELSPKQWWVKNDEIDKLIRLRYQSVHEAAAACELSYWREDALGRLAEIIVLDQFSRNIYRDTPTAFASDSLALALSQMAIVVGADDQLAIEQKSFLYMPFMHSESQCIHQQAEALFCKPGFESNYEFELKHKAIIDRFGRYPHRNLMLGRQSTSEELEFLKQPGSSF